VVDITLTKNLQCKWGAPQSAKEIICTIILGFWLIYLRPILPARTACNFKFPKFLIILELKFRIKKYILKKQFRNRFLYSENEILE